jgi:hypothetical protein
LSTGLLSFCEKAGFDQQIVMIIRLIAFKAKPLRKSGTGVVTVNIILN